MFLPVLQTCLGNASTTGRETELMTVLRAFSHFNRLAAILCLSRGPVTPDDLKHAMGTCVKTVEHHLEFLYAANLIEVVRAGAEPVVALREPTHPLAQVLLETLRIGARQGVDYRNAAGTHGIDAASRAVIGRIARCEGNLSGQWMRMSRMKPVSGRMTAEVRSALAEAVLD